MEHTDHAELNPGTAHPLISQLSCSMFDVEADLILEPESLLYSEFSASLHDRERA